MWFPIHENGGEMLPLQPFFPTLSRWHFLFAEYQASLVETMSFGEPSLSIWWFQLEVVPCREMQKLAHPLLLKEKTVEGRKVAAKPLPCQMRDDGMISMPPASPLMMFPSCPRTNIEAILSENETLEEGRAAIEELLHSVDKHNNNASWNCIGNMDGWRLNLEKWKRFPVNSQRWHCA